MDRGVGPGKRGSAVASGAAGEVAAAAVVTPGALKAVADAAAGAAVG